MSTRSILAVQTGDTWKGRYCHGDGYPSWQLRRLLELVQRDGLDIVRTTLVDMYSGWSHLNSHRRDLSGVQFDPEADYGTYECDTPEYDAWQLHRAYGERCINVPGYGVAYSTKEIEYMGQSDYRQIEEDDWRGPDEVEDCEWAYVLADHDILIFRATDRWMLCGRMGYDAQPSDDEVRVIECGENFEHCEHMAWVHFAEAKESNSRVSTSVWLGRSKPGWHDIKEVVVEDTGKTIAVGGGGTRGTAHSQNYDPYARIQYWWSSTDSGGDIRLFQCLKSGFKLEKGYSGVVVTSAGPQLIPAGTVLA